MPDPLSLNVQKLRPSETIAISNETKRRKAAGEDVYDLSVGEPDFDTPAAAAEAGIQAIRKGMTRYPANIGIAELRTAIAQNLSLLSGGRPVNADNIVVSGGSKQSLFNACFTLFGPHDRVLIPAPAWVSYPQIVHLTRAEPVLVPGDVEWGLKVSVRDLDRNHSKLTRGLILCSPCNPTGAVYTLAELRAIAEWARKHDIWIISDEIYRRINYGPGPAPSLLDLPDELLERTVIIAGASKAYAMTGWRIGAALAPPHVAKAMAALQSHTTTGPNHPAQWAAATAFSDERVEADVQRMVAAFRRRRDGLVERFRAEAPGIEFVEPHGAFYFFFRVDGIREGDPIGGAAFCDRLMQEEGVALVPGSAFGDDRWVRLSYAVSDKVLDVALERVLRFIDRLASVPAESRP
jgi:aspartate aminotransferase